MDNNKTLSADYAEKRDSYDSTKSKPVSNQDGFGSVASFLLLVVLIVSPWLLGGRHSFLLQFICVGVIAAVSCWLLSVLYSRQSRLFIPVVALPLLLAVLFGLIQLTPLSSTWVSKISPAASRLWSLSETPATWNYAEESQEKQSSKQTISLYPASTRNDASLLLLGVVVFFMASHFFASERAQTILWWSLTINGAALALFGFVQQMTWNGKLYWLHKPPQVNMAFGPYVNHNHAAGYLLMCLAGGLGLLMAHRVEKRRVTSASQPATQTRSSSITLITILTIGIVFGILCSLSRGGFVAMAGAGVVTLLIAAKYAGKGLKFPVQLWGVAAVAIAVLGATGLSSTVSQRIDSIIRQDLSSNTRIQHWKESIETVPDFWIAGSGLGTYRYIHRLYITEPTEEWFYHAENQYLEALIEGGVIGLGLILLLISMMLGTILFSLRKVPGLKSRPYALAALFALLSQSIHAFFDFGLYAPANMLLLAAICGAATGQACQFSEFARFPRLISFSQVRTSWVVTGIVALLLAQCFFPMMESRAATKSKVAYQELIDVANNEQASILEREQALFQFNKQLEQRPDNLRMQVAASQAWVDLYRRHAYLQLMEAKLKKQSDTSSSGGQTPRDLRLWQQTDLHYFHFRMAEWSQLGREDAVKRLRAQPVVKENLRPAFRHLLQARQSSPLLPWVHLTLGKLSVLINDPEDENPFLRPLTVAASRRADLMLRTGQLYYDAGDEQRANTCWELSMKRSERYAAMIYQFSKERTSGTSVDQSLMSRSPRTLIKIAKGLSEEGEPGEERQQLLSRAQQYLENSSSTDPETHYLKGVVSKMRHTNLEAIQNFQQAVSLAPDNMDWRYQYAELLVEEGHLQQALQQAKICAQVEKDNQKYRNFYLAIYSKASSPE